MYTRYEVYMYVYIHPYVHFLSFYALVVVIDDWNFVTCTAVSAQRRRRSLVCVKMYTRTQGTTIRYRSYLLCVLHVMYIIFFFFTYYTLVLLCMYSVTGYHTLGFQ